VHNAVKPIKICLAITGTTARCALYNYCTNPNPTTNPIPIPNPQLKTY